MLQNTDLVTSIDRLDKEDEVKTGKEAAHLGEIAHIGIPILKGFVITPNAYSQFLSSNKEVPQNLVRQIFRAYKSLDKSLKDATVVVGSSFSKKKFENVKGEAILIQKIKNFWNSYSDGKGIDYPDFEPAIFFYKMPPYRNFGVMFTIDPIFNDKNVVVIYEDNISGNQYKVSKPDLKIVKRIIKKGSRQILTDKQITNLAEWGKKLQEHYYFPQEVHFYFDRDSVCIANVKPITTTTTECLTDTPTVFTNHTLKKTVRSRKLIAKGIPIYPGIATGHLRIINKPYDIHKLKRGDVAVIVNARNIRLSDVKNKARAVIIENYSSRSSYHKLSHRFGKPMIITARGSSKVLKEGLVATVDGETGEVYLWHN